MSASQAFLQQIGAKQEKYLKVLRGLLLIDPAVRLDAAQALVQWEPNSPILAMPEVKQWLQTMNEQSKKVSHHLQLHGLFE